MFCNQCGESLPAEGAIVCPKCGAPVVEEAVNNTNQDQTVDQNGYPSQDTYQNQGGYQEQQYQNQGGYQEQQYQNQGGYQGQNPYQNQAPYQGQNPYQNQGGYQGQNPYHNSAPYQGEQKSKLVAGLLGIFLGGFGIHNFYLGNSTRGVIQIVVSLITCGIGSLWGFIEGIMILAGSINVDANGVPLKE